MKNPGNSKVESAGTKVSGWLGAGKRAKDAFIMLKFTGQPDTSP